MAPLSLRRAEARAQARSALGITSQTRPPAALIEAVMMLGDLLLLALTCGPSVGDAVRRCRLSLPDCEARFKLAALRLRVVVGGAACAARASRAAPRHAGRRPEIPAVPALPGPLDRARLSRASNERDGHGDGCAHGPQGGGGCVGCA